MREESEREEVCEISSSTNLATCRATCSCLQECSVYYSIYTHDIFLVSHFQNSVYSYFFIFIFFFSNF